MQLYRIDLPYACFGVVVDDNAQVVDAAPIGRWMVGKSLEYIRLWVKRKGGTLAEVQSEEG